MGNNRGAKALQFAMCLIVAFVVAVIFAPKVC